MPQAEDNRRQRRTWPFYVVGVSVGAGAVVAGVLIAASHPSAHAHRHGPVFVALFAGIAALLVAVMIVWLVRRQLNRPEMQRLRGASYAQRRGVARAVNSGTVLSEDQRRIARSQLAQLTFAWRRMRWTLPLAAVSFVVLAIVDTAGLRSLWVAIAALELVATAAAMLLLLRQSRRIEKALL